MHSSTRLIMDRRIRSEMPGKLGIAWQASTMWWWSASSLSSGAAYTRVLRCVQGQKYPSVMIAVFENISHNVPKHHHAHIRYSFSCNSQIKCFRTHVDMDILSSFDMWNSCPSFVRTFQLHSVYTYITRFVQEEGEGIREEIPVVAPTRNRYIA
jgi:hypothetical protein